MQSTYVKSNGTTNSKSGDIADAQNILQDLFESYSSSNGEESSMDLSSWRHFYRQTGLVDERITADKLDKMFQNCLSSNRRQNRQFRSVSFGLSFDCLYFDINSGHIL